MALKRWCGDGEFTATKGFGIVSFALCLGASTQTISTSQVQVEDGYLSDMTRENLVE